MHTSKTSFSEVVTVSKRERELMDIFIPTVLYTCNARKFKLVTADRFFDDGKQGFAIVNAIDPQNPVDVITVKESNIHDDGSIDMEVRTLDVEYDFHNQLIMDNWPGMWQIIKDRAALANVCEEGVVTVVPAGAVPMVTFDVLNKSYYIFSEMSTIKGRDGKNRSVPKKQYVKLVTEQMKFSEAVAASIQPLKCIGKWVVYGDLNQCPDNCQPGHMISVVDEKDLFKAVGAHPTDYAKLWELIEKRRCYPIYPITPSFDISELIHSSGVFIEQVIAENAKNPNFTKSSIIV